MLQLSIFTVCSVLVMVRTELSGKIVGGDNATIKDFPHAVYLEAGCEKESTSWICGSSLINEKLLLTAAHCIHGCRGMTEASDNMYAVAGVANLVEDSDGVAIEVNSLKAHEGFNANLLVCDIGLVGLAKRLPFGDNIKRIIIPQKFPDSKYFVIAGWGIVHEKTKAVDQKLKSVKQIINHNNGCDRLEYDRFCGIHTGSKTEYPASGDSGSGLVTSDHELAGLVSFSSSTDNPEFIVYTNVTFYYDWILHNSKHVYCNKK